MKEFDPYINVAKELISKKRHFAGTMFMHQMETFSILLNFNYSDRVLLKASLIHDVIEDIPDFDQNKILTLDGDSRDVLKLVKEVTKKEGETKRDFLLRILQDGSPEAKILKCADRISNMISIGYATDPKFIDRYCEETELYILPMALTVDKRLFDENLNLCISRRKFFELIKWKKTIEQIGKSD